MSIQVIAEEKLSEKHLDDVMRLYELCNESDSTKYTFDEDSDFQNSNEINTFLLYKDNLITSSLHIFAPTKSEAEITALTSPKERKEGYFKEIVEYAKKEILKRGIKSILYVCDVNSTYGNETVQHIGAEYEFSEFLMKYDKKKAKREFLNEKVEIEEANNKDLRRYIEINSKAFNADENETAEIIEEFFKSEKRELYGIKYENILIGMIGIYEEQSRYYIYGFCIDPEYQKKGIGHFALNEIVIKCKEKDRNGIIELEVQTRNEKALKVYKDTGFKIETEFRYYRDRIE